MKTKLKTGVEITYNKKGNIKSIKTPYDNDKYLQSSMSYIMYSNYYDNVFKRMFSNFNNFNNFFKF